jgi:hypothetical protein
MMTEMPVSESCDCNPRSASAAAFPDHRSLLLFASISCTDGDDHGQRCEHVGLNLKVAATVPMFVNRKWDMHLSPLNPGGPARARASKVSNRIKSKPKLVLTIFIIHLVTVGMFVWATFALGVYAVQPMVSTLLKEISRQKPQRKK